MNWLCACTGTRRTLTDSSRGGVDALVESRTRELFVPVS